MTAPTCPYSGRTVLSCKVSDLCDCFEFPEADAEAASIEARRHALRDAPAPTVTDRTQADRLPTGHVHLAHVGDTSDNELADLAGYRTAHFGYSVTRYPDEDAAVVHLFND